MTQRVEIPPDLETRTEKREYIRAAIDFHGFRWLVWEVSASGFFTDSYNLFATNVILPSLAFNYWPEETSTWRESLINSMTLGGSLVGQLLFGYLADRYGRTRLYGFELIVVIVATITICASSTGFGQSIDILPWLTAMRFAMGVGIGGEYPLSAAICTEWASTRARARMMSAVFLMQPLGQLAAQLVGLGVLMGYNSRFSLDKCTDRSQCGSHIDSVWRWVTGVGALPAIVAIYYRFRIKDPGLYALDVKGKDDEAVANTLRVYPRIRSQDWIEMRQTAAAGGATGARVGNGGTPVPQHFARRTDSMPMQLTKADVWEYFYTQGNWRPLAGTAICWFLLDVAFYGLGIGSPKTLAKLWAYVPAGGKPIPDDLPTWNPDLINPSIYDALIANAKHNLVTVSAGSLTGSVLLVFLIDYLPRKQFLIGSFIALATMFFVTGASFFSVFHTHNHAVSIVLIAICHFLFNFGANTLTFIIPAELFPTPYRATCHGIAAACGKLGALIVQVAVPTMKPNDNGLGWVFIGFGFVMALGSLFAWAWMPALQDPRSGANAGLKLPNKTLEELALGVPRAREQGQIVGMRDNFAAAFRGFRREWLGIKDD